MGRNVADAEQVRVYNSRTRDGWREICKKFEWALTPKEFSPVRNYCP